MAAVPQHHRTLLHAGDVVRAAKAIWSVPAAAKDLIVWRKKPFAVAAANMLKTRVLCRTGGRPGGWRGRRRPRAGACRRRDGRCLGVVGTVTEHQRAFIDAGYKSRTAPGGRAVPPTAKPDLKYSYVAFAVAGAGQTQARVRRWQRRRHL